MPNDSANIRLASPAALSVDALWPGRVCGVRSVATRSSKCPAHGQLLGDEEARLRIPGRAAERWIGSRAGAATVGDETPNSCLGAPHEARFRSAFDAELSAAEERVLPMRYAFAGVRERQPTVTIQW